MTKANPRHIVLVDDDLQVVRYLKKGLEENGYSVTATTSGKHAHVAIPKTFCKGPVPAGLFT